MHVKVVNVVFAMDENHGLVMFQLHMIHAHSVWQKLIMAVLCLYLLPTDEWKELFAEDCKTKN